MIPLQVQILWKREILLLLIRVSQVKLWGSAHKIIKQAPITQMTRTETAITCNFVWKLNLSDFFLIVGSFIWSFTVPLPTF